METPALRSGGLVFLTAIRNVTIYAQEQKISFFALVSFTGYNFPKPVYFEPTYPS